MTADGLVAQLRKRAATTRIGSGGTRDPALLRQLEEDIRLDEEAATRLEQAERRIRSLDHEWRDWKRDCGKVAERARRAEARLEHAEQALRLIHELGENASHGHAYVRGQMTSVAEQALAALAGDGGAPLAGALCTNRDHSFDGTRRDEYGNCPKCEAEIANGFEGAEADTPAELPVPPNADKRYEELDGG